MILSEVQLTKLAQDDPSQLAKILTSKHINANFLTFGIEILVSETQDENILFEPIQSLLKHINATVREAACLAASSVYINKTAPSEIIDKLKALSEHDLSPTVKDCAAMALKDILKD